MSQLISDEKFMQRALELAQLGLGHVSPNPLVGCVIVHEGKIIGEGYHKKYGEAHAEVNAVNSVTEKSLLKESTVYVTLEPCSHFGKTPPCADLLIREQVKKVVVANVDSNPLVAGKGITKLRDAGIEVVTGVLEKEAKHINRRFFTYIEKQRPYIILKWAQTRDGFIARSNYDSKWISNEYSRMLVHKWRTEEDAILVGSRTALHDNPQLNVRSWDGRNPVRVVIDRHLSLPSNLLLFDQTQLTFCYNQTKNEKLNNLEFIKLEEQGFMEGLLKDLHSRKIQSLIVEGGAQTLHWFINKKLWDEARVFESSVRFIEGIAAPQLYATTLEKNQIGNDTLSIQYNLPNS